MNLLIRVDASVAIGTGHVMRCLALAQTWQDQGGSAIFVMAETAAAVAERLLAEGFEVLRLDVDPGSDRDADQCAELALHSRADWVVVDGYRFGENYQRTLKNAGQRVLFFDDHGHARKYSADIVLNQNLHANERLYPNRESYTRLLLGPRYAMLRREFKPWRGRKREIPTLARKIVVTLGGSDPESLTQTLIRTLQKVQVDGMETTVVVGGSSPNVKTILAAAAHASPEIRVLVNPSNMAEVLASADLVICAAGTTSWEVSFLGLPSMLIEAADHQHAVAERLEKLGAAVHLDRRDSPEEAARQIERLIQSSETRRQLSQRAQKLVDGCGAARVVTFLSGEVGLRPTQPSDCRQLWEWANDPGVRAVSFSTEPIPWERHQAWFSSQLSDPSGMLYVATNREGRSIGQVRYHLEGDRAVLSVNLGAEFRGSGYGRQVLFLSTEDLFQRSRATVIDAFVKPENEAALHLFEGAGFQSAGMKNVAGQPALHFLLSKSVTA